MENFWSNTVWYVLLGIISTIELLYVLVKTDNPKLMFGLFLTFSGVVYMIEMWILGIYKGYVYLPKILHKLSPVEDDIIGNIFSQFSIASTALLLAFLKLKPYWYVICSIIYSCIEEVFLYLGIYKHNWYRTWMTLIGFPVILWFLNKIYQKTLNNQSTIFKYILIFGAVYVPSIYCFSWPFRLIGYPQFNKNIFLDEFISIIIQASINFSLLSITIMIAYYKKFSWKWHTVIIVVLYMEYYTAYIFNYIIYEDIGFLTMYASIQISGMYLSIFAIDKLYEGVSEKVFLK